MTTVAWDGVTLAADRRASGGGMPAVSIRKIRRCADGRLVGGAGLAGAVLALLDWVEAGMQGDAPVRMDSDEWSDVLLVEPGRRAGAMPRLFVLGRYGRYEIEAPHFAIGSGAAYALGAMACGKSAAEAVKIAARFDIATGPEVVELPLLPPDPAPRKRRALAPTL
jgi:ATP-dependent protease HslVU (ClpYQ) peptidase subunit